MKRTGNFNDEAKAKAYGRKTSAIIHAIILGLLAFPFMHMAAPEEARDVQVIIDFSSGSSQEGAKAVAQKAKPRAKIEKPKKATVKPVLVSKTDDTVPVIDEPKQEVEDNDKSEAAMVDELPSEEVEPTQEATASGMGSGDKGEGDSAEGDTASGNGKGFIEGSGVLTRAVIDRGNTKELAQQNGTLVLKICINKRGLVTYAEWDKDASSIKDSKVARTALDNVLEYRFEKDRNAPTKECGRLTYIIDVD